MYVVCLFVGLFLSYSSLKFDGTPLFSISVKPGLIAKQGKPASLPLGSWGRTNSGCRCLHVHGGKACWSRLLSCLMLARLPLLLQQVGKELQAELPDKLNIATSKMCLGKQKLKEVMPLCRKAKVRGWASAGDLQWQCQELRHRSLKGVLLHQWSFCLFILDISLIIFSFLLRIICCGKRSRRRNDKVTVSYKWLFMWA